jgi:hypothetical protein
MPEQNAASSGFATADATDIAAEAISATVRRNRDLSRRRAIAEADRAARKPKRRARVTQAADGALSAGLVVETPWTPADARKAIRNADTTDALRPTQADWAAIRVTPDTRMHACALVDTAGHLRALSLHATAGAARAAATDTHHRAELLARATDRDEAIVTCRTLTLLDDAPGTVPAIDDASADALRREAVIAARTRESLLHSTVAGALLSLTADARAQADALLIEQRRERVRLAATARKRKQRARDAEAARRLT